MPPSARKYPSWWGNTSRGHHSQAKGWIDAGWMTVPREINLRGERIRFERARSAGRRPATRELEQLRKQAMDVSGITRLDDLERASLTALIQREAGRMLIELGGTMPEFEVPARERPAW